MQVGDIVRVTNKGNLYSTYRKYFQQLCIEYLDGYDLAMQEYDIKVNDLARVLFIHNHTVFQAKELCVIEPLNKPGRYYLIGTTGIEECEEYQTGFSYVDPDISNDDLMSLFG